MFDRDWNTQMLGALNKQLIIYLTGFGLLVFFTDLSLMEFQVRYLALFLFFSVIDGFEWFRMGNLHKNIQIILISWPYTFPTVY